jgi:hypothetical protein
VLVRNDEITGFFQHEKRAVKADVRDVNLEGGNDLGGEKAEQEHGSCPKYSFHCDAYLLQRQKRIFLIEKIPNPYHESTKTGKYEKCLVFFPLTLALSRGGERGFSLCSVLYAICRSGTQGPAPMHRCPS